jgi:hypothetical protein
MVADRAMIVNQKTINNFSLESINPPLIVGMKEEFAPPTEREDPGYPHLVGSGSR